MASSQEKSPHPYQPVIECVCAGNKQKWITPREVRHNLKHEHKEGKPLLATTNKRKPLSKHIIIVLHCSFV